MYSRSILSSRRGRSLSVLALAGAVAGGGVAAAGPASAASTPTAMERCEQHDQPDVSQTLHQPADAASVTYPDGTANLIRGGDVFKVEFVDGYIAVGSDEYQPDGSGTKAPKSGFPFPGYPKYASMLRPNRYPTGWVPSSGHPYGLLYQTSEVNGRCIQWPGRNGDVRLVLNINEKPQDVAHNSGPGWTFQVSHYER